MKKKFEQKAQDKKKKAPNASNIISNAKKNNEATLESFKSALKPKA